MCSPETPTEICILLTQKVFIFSINFSRRLFSSRVWGTLYLYEVGILGYRYCMNIDQDVTHDTCMYVAMELYVCTYYVMHTGELEYVVVHGYWSTRSTFDIKQRRLQEKKNVVLPLTTRLMNQRTVAAVEMPILPP